VVIKIVVNELVSYVIGVRNMQNTVGKTIESILNQDYSNKEIILINDGSDDKTEDVLKNYPIEYINTEKIGISNARNLGYKKSRGKFIAFTDADVELDPSWTKMMLQSFIDDKVGLVGGVTKFRTDGSYCSIYRSLEFAKRYKNIKTEEVLHAGGPGFMCRRTVLEEINGFNPEWIHAEDVEVSFLVSKNGYKVIKQDKAIANHIPENSPKRTIKKGLRDSRAYIRVAKNHKKKTLKNKFHHTWYFPFDLVLLPIFYLFILITIIFLPIYQIIIWLFSNSILVSIFNIWIWGFLSIVTFLFIYSLIPSFQVFLKSKKLQNFIGPLLLHNIRGFAWGIGLFLGIIDVVRGKQ